MQRIALASLVPALVLLVACGGSSSDSSGSTAVAGGAGGAGGASSGAGGSSASGCGGAPGAAGSGAYAGAAAMWAQYCVDAAKKDAMCGGTGTYDCGDPACFGKVFNPATLPTYTQCLLAMACGKGGDDACADEASGTKNLTSAQLGEIDACNKTNDGCKAKGVSISSDYCVVPYSLLLSDGARAAGSACLAMTDCAARAACIDAWRMNWKCDQDSEGACVVVP